MVLPAPPWDKIKEFYIDLFAPTPLKPNTDRIRHLFSGSDDQERIFFQNAYKLFCVYLGTVKSSMKNKRTYETTEYAEEFSVFSKRISF